MEYIKIIGAGLVIFAGVGFGSCPVQKMKERIKEAEELYFCLLRLKSEISHGVKTLPEAILSATKSGNGKTKGSYLKMLRLIGKRMEKGGISYEILLRESAEESFSGSTITKEEQDAFVEAFLLLGGTDREKQVQALEFYAETIRLTMKEEKRKRKERAYLYRSLGVLGGIFLAVILY